MVGETLHNYDLQLCIYLLHNILGNLQEKSFARAARRQLSPHVLKYLAGDIESGATNKLLLLSDSEFEALKSAFEGEEPDLERRWVADVPLHRRRVQCVKEIRDRLTIQDAEDWSRASVGFAERLEREWVWLGEGIEIVYEWVGHLRRLIRAIE